MMRSVLVLLLSLCAAACGSGDSVGIHVKYSADGSAEVWTRSLLNQSDDGPVEAQATGVEWLQRARMVSSYGKVADIEVMKLGGIRFAADGGRLRVTIPCGPDSSWVDLFVPPPEEREAALGSYDPNEEQPGLGDRVVLELAVPGNVVSSGALPSLGIRADHDRSSATLEISAQSARTRKREIVWDVTWR